ncbi:MAG TPA: 1,4-alpha-glucan branching protein GlgB [Candidatus Binataceae bacterium]|nr:1,4-alpha-glucan branching protein GlgB [Candidatus Binataceae bacterium]
MKADEQELEHGASSARRAPSAAIGPVVSKIPAEQLKLLLELRHKDPHSILGAHPTERGVIVRAYRPDAERIMLLIDGEAPRAMVERPEPGLFEILVTDRRQVFPYRIEVHYADDEVVTLRQPYSFAPTLGELDLHLWAEQKHQRIWDKLGAHVREIDGVRGIGFAVWAPNAAGVSVVGDFNNWDGRLHMMRMLGSSGVWEVFVPELAPGEIYKYEIRTADHHLILKSDPFAQATECPPATASKVYQSSYRFKDNVWMAERARRDPLHSPAVIYEVHLGSWRQAGPRQPLTYRQLAEQLADYVSDLGFTHVEFMPVMEHPFGGSWGYEVTGYYAPTARYGTPDDFRFLVDTLHQRGIGVILDWAPAHFPSDAFALGRFDGTALFEHIDPRQGFHPEWNTYIFNFGRNEVRSFLLGSAHYWLDEFHVDGLRVDAVSSMLYLDYGRNHGEWIPNMYGGNENLEAISFLKELNQQIYARHPGVMMIAEESTAWAGVSRPVYVGGLGFGFKWDMGWMHDTLEYFSKEPIHRRYHHRDLTFGFLYAWFENFILPLSHDEVVYGKRALLDKMPGDRWQKFANLRSLFGYMWARAGKKVLFMGGEFGQWYEWQHDYSLDWHLLEGADHRGVQNLVRDLNRIYRAEPALWERDHDPSGFQWIDANNTDENVIAFMRISPSTGRRIVCVGNFSPVVRTSYRVGVPVPGLYREILNTDAEIYGGSNKGNAGAVMAENQPWHGLPFSLKLILPPLATVWFEVPL